MSVSAVQCLAALRDCDTRRPTDSTPTTAPFTETTTGVWRPILLAPFPSAGATPAGRSPWDSRSLTVCLSVGANRQVSQTGGSGNARQGAVCHVSVPGQGLFIP